MSGVVDEPCSPILCSSWPVLTPVEAALDDEGGEVLAVDLGKYDEDVGEAAVGNPHLLACEREPAVGQPNRTRGGAERIRSRARLAQRIRADHLAGNELRKIASFLIG